MNLYLKDVFVLCRTFPEVPRHTERQKYPSRGVLRRVTGIK